ncbi:MAG TPA: fatty acid-binding protein DegV [Syntrophomonas sp.]|jgi:DegV family protein with EDD domain|nr:fatty acid-binding protein DegV [Syntrophomonas sp.]
MGIRVFTDSTSYIDEEIRRRLNIQVLQLSVHFPDESFKENEVEQSYFYRKVEQTGIIPTSSQPSQGEFLNAFRDCLSQGDAILGIFISSAMSGTCPTALAAREQLLQEYPGARVEIVDSYTNCMALGLQVISAAEVVQAGGSMEDALEAAAETRRNIHFYFVPETLEYLKKGGRIGTASALLGTILKIRPILTVDMAKGMTHLLEKTRGNAAAIRRILEMIEADHLKKGLKALIVHHINAANQGSQLRDALANKYQLPVGLCSIGPVIGLHTGLGTIGFAYCTY